MSLALRPYVTAGVALVGASVIAVTPVAAPLPAIQTHAVQLSAAIDNPIDVFAPVFDKANTVIQAAIQAEIDKPSPVINGLIGHTATDIKTLGAIGNGLSAAWTPAALAFPQALADAAQLAAAGRFTDAINRFQGVFFGPIFSSASYIAGIAKFVQSEFATAGQFAFDVTDMAIGLTYGQLLNLFTPILAVTRALDELAKAIPSGDPGEIVNAVQHGIANIAVGALTFVNSWRNSFEFRRVRMGQHLNPPPASSALSAEATTSSDVANTPLQAAPASPEKDATATIAATDAAEPAIAASVADGKSGTAQPAVRESLVAIPGKTGTLGTTNKPAAKVASEVRDGISATVNKIGEGVKKAIAKPEKKSTNAATGADKGASTGSSGDAK